MYAYILLYIVKSENKFIYQSFFAPVGFVESCCILWNHEISYEYFFIFLYLSIIFSSLL